MIDRLDVTTVASTLRQARLLVLLPVAFSMSACAGSGFGEGKLLDQKMARNAAALDIKKTPQNELQKATLYWGKKFTSNPRDAKIAVNYARNLKAMGEKRRALAVLQQASIFNGRSRALASEYGRLALELGQVGLAQKLLARADNPVKPDWRVVSARGAALAKLGKQKEALSFFERASILAPNQSSVQNNLAMAYTMDGRPEKAEVLLRKALLTAKPQSIARVRQNLSLVLGLQGKYDEAKTVAAPQIGKTAAAANVNAIQQLVRLKPQLTGEARATQIIELAKIASEPETGTRRVARKTSEPKKKRVALRRRKPQPAPTSRAPLPAKVAQSTGAVMFRPTMHTTN